MRCSSDAQQNRKVAGFFSIFGQTDWQLSSNERRIILFLDPNGFGRKTYQIQIRSHTSRTKNLKKWFFMLEKLIRNAEKPKTVPEFTDQNHFNSCNQV